MSAAARSDVVSHPPLPVRRGGARASTWWGKAWVRAVEESAYAEDDLRAGRALARHAAVGGISIARGRMVAAVSDPAGLWTVDCRLPVLDDPGTAALVEVVAAQVGRVGALLAGLLPHDLVEHADEAGAELLPFGGELEASCTCEAWVDPCPHALAVLHQVTWLLEADPLTLLHLRGLPREELLARLHARAAGPDEAGRDEAGRDEAGRDGPDDDPRLDVALDAALRAGELLDRLEHGGPVDDLW